MVAGLGGGGSITPDSQILQHQSCIQPQGQPSGARPCIHLTEHPFHLLGLAPHVHSVKNPLTELCGSQREEKRSSA